MKFKIKRASSYFDTPTQPCDKAYLNKKHEWEIDICSLKALMELIEETDDDLIISPDQIIIYDDYVE